jgi:hypothetical protein
LLSALPLLLLVTLPFLRVLPLTLPRSVRRGEEHRFLSSTDPIPDFGAAAAAAIVVDALLRGIGQN